jgi:NAD(P)-dependent dehydrogenase (short-subunit alcohol dehydrogenase family)
VLTTIYGCLNDVSQAHEKGADLLIDNLAVYPSLRDKVVVISGGATGIGEAFVRGFARAGARVAFLDIQDEAARLLVEQIAATGAPQPLYLRTDVTDINAVEAAFDAVLASLGPASVLVNNAANDSRQALEEVTVDSFDASLNVNLRHVFFASRAAARQMRRLGAGSIINLSSGAWVAGIEDLQAYSAAKAAIVGLTNSLARQLGTDNIRVNAVAPGAVLTERQLRLWMNPAAVAKVVEQQCIHERLEPDHITGAVLFLAADDSRMITRQCLFVNAGLR